MSVPGRVVPDLVVVQTGLAIGPLEALLGPLLRARD